MSFQVAMAARRIQVSTVEMLLSTSAAPQILSYISPVAAAQPAARPPLVVLSVLKFKMCVSNCLKVVVLTSVMLSDIDLQNRLEVLGTI